MANVSDYERFMRGVIPCLTIDGADLAIGFAKAAGM